MNHQRADSGAGSPRAGATGRADGPGTPGGPGGRDAAPGPATGGVRADGPTPPEFADHPDAGRAWAVLTATDKELTAQEVATAASLLRITALAVLLAFEQAGYVLRIPSRSSGGAHPDLWVLAGGVREGQSVADAVRSGLLEQLASCPPHEPATRGSAEPDSPPESAASLPLGPVTGNPILPRGGLKELVLALLVEHYPNELGPAGISKLLGSRSTGAIRNAADSLCREGKAVCTDPAVRRYAALRPDGVSIEHPGESESLA